jgi:cytochrome d ubiquinol oxidase subunit I
VAAKVLKDNVAYFGYGYIKDVNELVPNVPLTFYMFRVMVMLGGYFILFFIVVLFLAYKKDLSRMPWMHWVAMLTIPLGYLAGQAGWVVAECGRHPVRVCPPLKPRDKVGGWRWWACPMPANRRFSTG